MWWHGDGLGGWGIALMTISMVAFWALVIVAVVAVIRYLGRPSQQPPMPPAPPYPSAPEQVLADRFARGEIDEEEYRRRIEVLRHSGQDAGQALDPPASGPAARS
ncbi:SHOCT domain-containing protein [Candidatus Protofrankia datiscae]|uniref:SHOCT domain-containing protein n=2 Tax=Frankiaceae TaxID=74712 RepID=F8AXV7_9ACTN|nr:SHOCT domain-containing protein [Candidatus Protofrankia datiscae]AEH11528.1 Protein of unknown function DUF2078, membrane [Candidatus Protofrankia datiscae]